VLDNWTAQGIRKSRKPLRELRQPTIVTKAEGRKQLFYAIGKCDFVAIIEVPEDGDIVAISLCIDSIVNNAAQQQ